MALDAIIIAGSGQESLGASNPLRLRLDGHTATVQVVKNALAHDGKVAPPIDGDAGPSWESSFKLNGVYLYNVLVKAGYDVELIDDYRRESALFEAAAACAPRAVVISTTFMVSREDVLDLVRDVKRRCPTAAVIVGGPFVHYSWRVWQRRNDPLYQRHDVSAGLLFFAGWEDDPTDLYVVSDVGEALLEQTMARILSGRGCDDLPNTALPGPDGYRFAARIDDAASWQETPIDWATLPERVFASGVVTMRASTGCPYRCNFCNFNKNRHLTRVKPVDELVAEMRAVQLRGARYVWFADDNFRLGKRDLDQVCRSFVEQGLSLKWMSLLRAEALRDVDLDLLRRAGCIEVQMGVESADSQVLTAMNKQSDPEQNEAVIARLLKAGINCSCYFVVGYPGETADSVDRTIAFLKRLEAVDGPGVLKWSLYPFLLAPGSPVYEEGQRALHELEGHLATWRHRSMDAKAARASVLRMFMALDRSGPIYRGDNLDQMNALTPGQVRQFAAARHALEKAALQRSEPITPDQVKTVFGPILSNEGGSPC